jgi:hypothetical protein
MSSIESEVEETARWFASPRQLFRNFRSEANVVLRDGQTARYTVATAPVSGEMLKIDVTLNVVK